MSPSKVPSLKRMFVPPVKTDLGPSLSTRDHSVGTEWHTLGPPNHLAVDKLERNWVAPVQKALTEELTPFMEEYFWRVDNGTQGDLYRAMCTPTVMYYNNCQKQVYHGYDEADEFEHAHAGKRWLKHQMDRLTILPTYNDEGPVLVHVLGTSWIGLKVTKNREEQKKLEKDIKATPFSETFEVVKVDGEWKFSRIILMMHDDILGMYHEKGIDLIPGMFD